MIEKLDYLHEVPDYKMVRKINEIIDVVNELTEHQPEGKEPKPLHCPFCGGEGKLVKYGDNGWYVACQTPGCAIKPSTNILADKEKVIAKWNRRAK